MKSKLLWLLLGTSLTLNVFFVGGGLFARASADRLAAGPAARQSAVADRLDLSQPQRAAFRELRGAVRERMRAAQGELKPAREALRAELQSPDPSPERIAAAVKRLAEVRHQAQLDVTDITADFLGELAPDQRRRFVMVASRRGGPLGLPGRPRRRDR